MLWEEVKKYAELTGLTREEAINVPIIKAGAYLDGYDKGTKVLGNIRSEIEQELLGYPPSADYYKAIMKCLQIIDKYKEDSEVNEDAKNSDRP